MEINFYSDHSILISTKLPPPSLPTPYVTLISLDGIYLFIVLYGFVVYRV